MMELGGVVRMALAVALLLASLSFVTWRQSRAFEALAELDRLRDEAAVARAQRSELMRRIQFLESRVRVVPEARKRLGMHMPSAEEMVFLSGDLP